MLTHLHLRNVAVVSEAAVRFQPGLNVLSGETGAGKSIVVDSLALLAGARASTDLIRTGADVLTVSGTFDDPSPACAEILESSGIQGEPGSVVVRREIQRNGRNRVFLNDQPVTLRLLTEIAPLLLRIHGQREELGLVQPELQRIWLDRQGDEAGQRHRALVASLFAEYRSLADRLDSVSHDERARQERIDLLTYQVSEIESAAIEPGEEEELARERDLLRHSEEISRALATVVARLVDEEGAASEDLAAAATAIGDIEQWEPEAAVWGQELDELRIRSQELAHTVRTELGRLETDPERLVRVEDRLAVVERLCRKYGPTSRDVVARRETMRSELEKLEDDACDRESLAAEADECLARYSEAAQRLSAARSRWAERLERRVREELEALALAGARFEIRLQRKRLASSPLRLDGEAVELGEHGIDRVTFLFSPNPGEELRPLANVASGGELSRVYLVLQLLARDRSPVNPPTLVFDEVDSGVGGVEAVHLGRKLRELAEGAQILCVTHLPQIASQGDHHFKVGKSVRGKRTFVSVERLSEPGRVDEIARMLGGEEAAAASRMHAEKMLAESIRS